MTLCRQIEANRRNALGVCQAHNLKVIGSNPIPATTFVITHSPSRSNRWDGFSFLGIIRGDGTGPAACGITNTDGRLFPTEHPRSCSLVHSQPTSGGSGL